MNNSDKPCPFCGGDALELVIEHHRVVVYIQCDKCRAIGPGARVFLSGKRAGDKDAIERAHKQWNERR